MKEAFVYSWRNLDTNRIYVGWHKGSEDDGYICSSRVMKEEYAESPQSFERFIISRGTKEQMTKLETIILRVVDAKNNPEYYNQHNGNGLYNIKKCSESTKRKMSVAHKGKIRSTNHSENISKSLRESTKHKERLLELSTSRIGTSHSEKAKENMRNSHVGKIHPKPHSGKQWHNNGKINKLIFPKDIENTNWIVGRLKGQ